MNHDSRRLGIPSRFRLFGTRSSAPIHLNFRIEMLEFDAGIVRGELPIGLGVMFIALGTPSGDFIDESLLVGNSTVETLG